MSDKRAKAVKCSNCKTKVDIYMTLETSTIMGGFNEIYCISCIRKLEHIKESTIDKLLKDYFLELEKEWN